jgi:maltose O-acetyltransferase
VNRSVAWIVRIYGRLLRRWQTFLAWTQLRGCTIGTGVWTTGRVLAEGRRNILIGPYSLFAGGLIPTRLIAHGDGQLRIGRGCVFNYGARLEAHERIEIGIGCMFGTNVSICDRDEHGTAPIVLEDQVWLAHAVEVRPGVRIGRRAVVSAGSVVTTDIPAETVAIGNPARALPLRLVAS